MGDIQAIGITRFSYAALGGFQEEHATPDERLGFLFTPQRIEERLALFEHVTLPSLRAQTDPDFTHIILISAAMPAPYLDRLAGLIDGIPQIALVAKEPQDHIWAIRRAIRPFIDPDVTAVAQYRLDDDDAVAVDFIARAKAGFAPNAAHFEHAGRFGLDFNQGFFLDITQGDMTVRRCVQRLTTAGLVVYLPPDAQESVLDFVHHRLNEYMPFETDETKHMFLRCINHFNDCPWTRNKSGKLKPAKRDLRGTFDARFHIDLPHLATALGLSWQQG